MKNVVDSSAWLEYFADTKRAKYFSKVIEDVDNLIVPSITLYEIFKKLLLEKNETAALRAVAHMRSGSVVDLDITLSLQAAKISVDNKIPMADSIILATARLHNATLWTQDADFEGITGVQYFKK